MNERHHRHQNGHAQSGADASAIKHPVCGMTVPLDAGKPSLELAGGTVMFVIIGSEIAGLVAVADPVKETTPDALKALHAEGFHIIMATGDNERTAKAAGVLYPFFGILISPIFAAAAMRLSSVSVIGNALRLRSVKI